VLAEVRAVRQTQEEILALLRGGSGSPRATPGTEVAGVLVIDDDAGARDAVAAAFSDEGVTAHVVPDGNQALAAIAEAKPAVIVLEIEIGGSMPGPDVLGMIKATMDWLDIPVILHTRASIPNEEAARADYGADHLVLKGPGSPQTLVALVHELLQKA
jgi:DNA-binding response OmpR family regulator